VSWGQYKIHLLILVGVWAVAQSFVFWIYLRSVGGDNSFNLVPLIAAIGAPLGPLAGGIARMSEPSCMAFSFRVLVWFLPFLGLTFIGFYGGKKAGRNGLRIMGFVAWAVGLFGWMLGAVLSLGFALG